MNIRAISARGAATAAEACNNSYTGGFGRLRTAMSRREFTRNAAAGAAFGLTFGPLWNPILAEQKRSFAPVPIPGGSPALGGSYHVFGPAGIDPIDAEPSTITNLNGLVGLAYISGMVTQTDVAAGAIQRYPFVDSDMRFMNGVFRGADGRLHQGAFVLI